MSDTDDPNFSMKRMALGIYENVKDLAKAEIDKIRQDAVRLDWLEKQPDELEYVRSRVNNSDGDGTVREAIDYFMKVRAKETDR